jgi:nicotianamine synthase
MEDLKIFDRILKLESLKPSTETNDAFFELVSFCSNNKQVSLKSNQIKKLRELSSHAEYEMEVYWAKRIIASKNGEKELQKFWYFKNYEQLVDLEYSNISSLYKKIKKVLFVGGGPLPLTAILLHKKYGVKCTILEKDAESHRIATLLLQKLNLTEAIKVTNIHAEDYSGYNSFNLIYLAAMVGEDEASKTKIISLLHTKINKGKVLVCRSSHGTRKLLYTPIAKELLKEINPVLEVRPYNSIINSFFILQKT